jgi:glycosyltransferase involved in cell wall biosynthesis
VRILFLPGYRYPASLEEPITCGDLRYSFNLSRALVRAGASVAVLTRKGPDDDDEQVLDGVMIHRYRPELAAVFPTSFDVSARRRRCFRRLVLRSDLVLANSPLSLELTVDTPRPLVYVCSGLEDVRNYSVTLREVVQLLGVKLLRDPLKRMTWKRAARVNTTAEKEAVTLVGLGVPCERITTIGPGVEVERYTPACRERVEDLRDELFTPDEGRRRVILTVSRFTPAKGLVETLRAFSRLAKGRSDVNLVIVGVRHSHRSDYFARVQRAVSELGLEDRVVIRENVPESRLPLYYSLADVTSVFSVGYDPLPTVIIESMSCGTPVVSTAFDTRTQMISHAESGLMVPEKDEAAWLSAVNRLLDDEAFSHRVRTAALVKVREQFDMNRVAGQYLDLFRSL